MIYYPQEVEEQLYAVINAAKLHTKVSEESIHDVFGDFLFKKWLNGDEGDEDLEEVSSQLLKQAMALDTVNNLLNKGYMDSIECDGKEVVFLTAKGKKHFNAENLQDINLNTLAI